MAHWPGLLCRYIVLGSEDKTVRIWDAETGVALFDPLEGHTYGVASVAFSPDGRRIVSGGDETVRVWDAETGAALFDPLKGHTAYVTSVAFSPDSRHIVSGSGDKTVRVWDAETGAAVFDPLEGHTDFMDSAAFSSDHKQAIPNSISNSLRMQIVSWWMHRPVMRKLAQPTDQDGWIRQSDHAVMLWVPLEYRHGLIDQSVMSIPIDASVTIECSQFRHGTAWMEVHG